MHPSAILALQKCKGGQSLPSQSNMSSMTRSWKLESSDLKRRGMISWRQLANYAGKFHVKPEHMVIGYLGTVTIISKGDS